MATQKTIENAYKALPHLVQCAKGRRTITYKELSNKIGCHWRAATWFLGYIRDEICAPRKLPYITALVVNQETGLPGSEWLPEGTDTLSPGQYRRKYEAFREEVYRCQAWDNLLKELGLKPIA